MNEAEKQRLISELKEFYNRLRRYQNRQEKRRDTPYGCSPAQDRSLNALRLELQREHGRLDGAISKYGGIGYMSGFAPLGGPYMRREVFGFILGSLAMDRNRLKGLDSAISLVNKTIGKLESTPIAELGLQEVNVTEPPKVFVAHGGESPALDKLKKFLLALGVEPLVVEEQASGGKSIGEKVDWYAKQADFAVVLATKGDKDSKTGGFIPRGNVLIEIGKAQELFPDRTIYLLQAGTKFPTNISEKVWVRFVPQSMDDSFTEIAKELCAFGILKAVKPVAKEHTS